MHKSSIGLVIFIDETQPRELPNHLGPYPRERMPIPSPPIEIFIENHDCAVLFSTSVSRLGLFTTKVEQWSIENNLGATLTYTG